MALSVQIQYKHTRLKKEPTSELVSHQKACRGAWFGQTLCCSLAMEQRSDPKGSVKALNIHSSATLLPPQLLGSDNWDSSKWDTAEGKSLISPPVHGI